MEPIPRHVESLNKHDSDGSSSIYMDFFPCPLVMPPLEGQESVNTTTTKEEFVSSIDDFLTAAQKFDHVPCSTLYVACIKYAICGKKG